MTANAVTMIPPKRIKLAISFLCSLVGSGNSLSILNGLPYFIVDGVDVELYLALDITDLLIRGYKDKKENEEVLVDIVMREEYDLL